MKKMCFLIALLTVCAVNAQQEASPWFTTNGGIHNDSALVGLQQINPNSSIRYTLDGTLPTETSTLYTEPFWLTETKMVTAVCFGDGTAPSDDVKRTYAIDEWGLGTTATCIFINSDPANFFDPETGIYMIGSDAGLFPYIPTAFNYGANFWHNIWKESTIEIYDPIDGWYYLVDGENKITGNYSRYLPQKGLFEKLNEDVPRANWLDKPNIDELSEFILRNRGNNNLEFPNDAWVQTAVKSMSKAMTTSYRPCSVFINGQYWGWYEMREPISRKTVAYNIGEDKDSLTVYEYGSDNDEAYIWENDSIFPAPPLDVDGNEANSIYFWNARDVVVNNDPFSPEYFSLVSEVIDIESFIDLYVVLCFTGDGDHSNISEYGAESDNYAYYLYNGKLYAILQDYDRSFGQYFGMEPNFAQLPTLTNFTDAPYPPNEMCGHLMMNQEFKIRFINRYADMVNTVLSPEHLEEVGFEIYNGFEELLPRHIERWGGDLNAAHDSLVSRIAWIKERRILDPLNVVNFFNLPDTINITLDVSPAGAGRIHISTSEPSEDEYPWTGLYFAGNPIRITAIANPGYTFVGWNPNSIFPVGSNSNQFTWNFEVSDTLRANFIGAPMTLDSLLVTEFMRDSLDYVELHNSSTCSIDISGFTIRDDNDFHEWQFPLGTVLEPNEFVVVDQNQMDFGLNKVEDQVRLYDHNDSLLVQIEWDNSWAYQENHSLEYLGGQYWNDDNFVLGCLGGSPWVLYDPLCGEVWVDEVDNDQFPVYPNPANDWIKISEIGEVLIFDQTGRMVKTLQNNGQKVDISDLSQGIYILRMQNANTILVIR